MGLLLNFTVETFNKLLPEIITCKLLLGSTITLLIIGAALGKKDNDCKFPTFPLVSVTFIDVILNKVVTFINSEVDVWLIISPFTGLFVS